MSTTQPEEGKAEAPHFLANSAVPAVAQESVLFGCVPITEGTKEVHGYEFNNVRKLSSIVSALLLLRGAGQPSARDYASILPTRRRLLLLTNQPTQPPTAYRAPHHHHTHLQQGVDFDAMMVAYKFSGFQATNLGNAIDEVNRMVRRIRNTTHTTATVTWPLDFSPTVLPSPRTRTRTRTRIPALTATSTSTKPLLPMHRCQCTIAKRIITNAYLVTVQHLPTSLPTLSLLVDTTAYNSTVYLARALLNPPFTTPLVHPTTPPTTTCSARLPSSTARSILHPPSARGGLATSLSRRTKMTTLK